jgi:hypothetical protein
MWTAEIENTDITCGDATYWAVVFVVFLVVAILSTR